MNNPGETVSLSCSPFFVGSSFGERRDGRGQCPAETAPVFLLYLRIVVVCGSKILTPPPGAPESSSPCRAAPRASSPSVCEKVWPWRSGSSEISCHPVSGRFYLENALE